MTKISSFHCSKYPNGTYSLIFNTTKRWEIVHKANETTYIFGEGEDEEELRLEIFLPEIEKGMYISGMSQDKYQTRFLFMPFSNDEISLIKDVPIKILNQ